MLVFLPIVQSVMQIYILGMEIVLKYVPKGIMVKMDHAQFVHIHAKIAHKFKIIVLFVLMVIIYKIIKIIKIILLNASNNVQYIFMKTKVLGNVKNVCFHV